ncbi:hypothetical protein KQX54_013367 [Cotesia glomerata]|uniref:C2H2-type domain-containing protein n=1 Tax=Cotesia glomerata TaxID=32391 RepID=A0AAV7IPR7_COTGL|nr:hypothetical protein KQX54_013367 [Cotesia glomerata]
MNADEFARIFGLLPTPPPPEAAEIIMDFEEDLLNRSDFRKEEVEDANNNLIEQNSGKFLFRKPVVYACEFGYSQQVCQSEQITISSPTHEDFTMNADEFARIFGLLPTPPPPEAAEIIMDFEEDLLNQSDFRKEEVEDANNNLIEQNSGKFLFRKPVVYACEFGYCTKIFYDKASFQKHRRKHLQRILKCRLCFRRPFIHRVYCTHLEMRRRLRVWVK